MQSSGRLATSTSISRLCSLGLFLAGYIFYSSSLIQTFYAAEFQLSSWQIGMAQSAVPLGAILGAVFAGRLADLFGRHRLLVWNFLLLIIVGLLSGCVFDVYSLCTMRVVNGFLAGTLYPLCAAYLTEMTPEASLARQSAILMFINCMAAPIGCILAMLLSFVFSTEKLWRVLSMCHALPAFIAYYWSLRLPESIKWLSCEMNTPTDLPRQKMNWHSMWQGMQMLFNVHYREITLCLMGSWFLMDVAYYGINFFVPYLLQVMQVKVISSAFSGASLLSNVTIWGTLIINLFFALGAATAIFIVTRVNLFNLQKFGFLFASLSLLLLAMTFHAGWHQVAIVILLFVIFNFALNVGPDVTTYLLSATAYPVAIRGSGHGFIAGFAKFGSFLGVLFLPHLQDLYGIEMVIFFLGILLLIAFALTIKLANAAHQTTSYEVKIAYETN